MKKVCFVLLLLLALAWETQAQKEWAVGIRAGEPVALSLKKYLNAGQNAIEVNIGTYGYAYGYDGYRGNNGRYRYYRDRYFHRGGIVVMANYLWHNKIADAEGLQWYWGVGGQLRNVVYSVDRDNDGDFDEEVSTIGLGPNGVVGLEWFIPDLEELSVFVDTGLYAELVPNPWLNLNVGIGVRFNF